MQITISLHGVFRIGRFKKKNLEYPAGSRAGDAIEDLQIPPDLLGIVLINGKHATAEQELRDGDLLMLLPLLEGG